MITITDNYQKRPIFFLNKSSFKGKFIDLKNIPDIFIKNTKGIKQIKDIKAGVSGGTVCSGSIPLTDFWQNFPLKTIERLKRIGRSTNIKGYARSFLKENANVPISTSFVHDCSVMYLYNEKTNTHFLYHAEADASIQDLNFVIETMMPEGFTHGAIKPGCSLWSEEHVQNMHNMFEIMKKQNPKAIINVYNDSSWFPEIVGYQGKLYEIPNKYVIEQKHNGVTTFKDKGQASFRILDLQNSDTIYLIMHDCDNLEQAKIIKNQIQNSGFPKNIEKLLIKKLEQKIEQLKAIASVKTVEESIKIEKKLPRDQNLISALRAKYEDLLIQKLKKVKTIEELDDFYEEAQCFDGFDYMKKLRLAIMKKEDEIFK